MPSSLSGAAGRVAAAVDWHPPADYRWTRDVCTKPLEFSTVNAIVEQAREAADKANLVLPGGVSLLQRCVLALITGNLILQGPPGTGKTPLAKILAGAFNASLGVTTATAEWSSFDVVGGMQPSPSGDGSLVPVLGAVPAAALKCAEQVRDVKEQPGEVQAHWLLIDELNRADIDKAIGSLYTVLSQVSPSHLHETPIELWYNIEKTKYVWVPYRFRLIGTMNDVHTSFVNSLSQGLTRRFQFVYLGVSTGADEIRREIDATWTAAGHWYAETRHAGAEVALDEERIDRIKELLCGIVQFMRDPDGLIRWPIGSAQILDVLRRLTVGLHEGIASSDADLVDDSVADRMVPQAGTLDEMQLEALEAEFARLQIGMPRSVAAVKHLRDTRSTQ